MPFTKMGICLTLFVSLNSFAMDGPYNNTEEGIVSKVVDCPIVPELKDVNAIHVIKKFSARDSETLHDNHTELEFILRWNDLSTKCFQKDPNVNLFTPLDTKINIIFKVISGVQLSQPITQQLLPSSFELAKNAIVADLISLNSFGVAFQLVIQTDVAAQYVKFYPNHNDQTRYVFTSTSSLRTENRDKIHLMKLPNIE